MTAKTVLTLSVLRLKPHQIVSMCCCTASIIHLLTAVPSWLTLNCKHRLQYFSFSLCFMCNSSIAPQNECSREHSLPGTKVSGNFRSWERKYKGAKSPWLREKLRELAYTSMCRSVLKYASPVWDPYLQRDIDNLERIQRKGTRFVLRDFHQRSSVASMLWYLKWEPLSERRTKARLIIIYRIIKVKTEIPTDTADLQPGRCGHFIQHTHHYQQYKTVFIHGQSVIETYYHPGSKILPLWTVSRTDYLSVTTKLVSPLPRYDTHLGETSIHQIQIQVRQPGFKCRFSITFFILLLTR